VSGIDRIQQARAGCPRGASLKTPIQLGVDEAEADRLVESGAGQQTAISPPVILTIKIGPSAGAARQRGLQQVIAGDTGHLFDQIFLDPHVDAPGRRQRLSSSTRVAPLCDLGSQARVRIRAASAISTDSPVNARYRWHTKADRLQAARDLDSRPG
jgi:hypothetical protein